MPQWQQQASMISHWVLYGLLFLLPLTGWLMSSASAYSVSWFNLIQLPDLVGPDPQLEEVLEEVHKTFAKILFLLASIHIVAALKHSLIDKDGAIGRISSSASTAVFVVVIILGVYGLTRTGTIATALEDLTASDLPVWNIDHESSDIRFTAEQAGVDFDGEWMLWSAEMRFDGDRLDDSSFDVNVVVSGVETNDDDRDQTLLDMEWFDATAHPEVFYRAVEFAETEDGYVAYGNIIVKGLAFPASLNFNVSVADGRYELDGTIDLDRLVLQIGTGEWADPTCVGQFVAVSVHVEATVTE
jgi:polyisoprenoid-binding protein YceI